MEKVIIFGLRYNLKFETVLQNEISAIKVFVNATNSHISLSRLSVNLNCLFSVSYELFFSKKFIKIIVKAVAQALKRVLNACDCKFN